MTIVSAHHSASTSKVANRGRLTPSRFDRDSGGPTTSQLSKSSGDAQERHGYTIFRGKRISVGECGGNVKRLAEVDAPPGAGGRSCGLCVHNTPQFWVNNLMNE